MPAVAKRNGLCQENGRWEKGGVGREVGVLTCAAFVEAAALPPPPIPEGAFAKAMYPYTPSPPHKSSGYPGHCSVQPEVVESGA